MGIKYKIIIIIITRGDLEYLMIRILDRKTLVYADFNC